MLDIAFTKSANHPGTLELKLIDFGLSKLVKKRPAVNILARYRMTGETGSPRYMAPECHLNLPYNEKVDVYR
jgi:serine/threonine protein kinase